MADSSTGSCAIARTISRNAALEWSGLEEDGGLARRKGQGRWWIATERHAMCRSGCTQSLQ
jgi:hypothetical protein